MRRALTILGLVSVDSEAFNALRLDEAARGVLRGETSVMLRESRPEPTGRGRKRGAASAGTGRGGAGGGGAGGTAGGAAESDLSPADEDLFQRLRAWRARQAKAANLPAYVILHDATLRGIARVRPTDVDALAAISGVGARKRETYGEALLAVVRGEDPAP